jgi:hypothetical protein
MRYDALICKKREIVSYDLRVWCVNEVRLRDIVPDPHKWTFDGKHGYDYESRDWQIGISCASVEGEDVPDEISAQLPGIKWQIDFILSPIDAVRSAHSVLNRAARAVAAAGHGLIENPQTNEITLPAGIRRYTKSPRDERLATLDFSWFVNNDSLRRGQTLDRVVDLLKRHLPEAIARRYGEFEPPENKLHEKGETHYREFLRESPRSLISVFYTTRPVTNFHIDNSAEPGPSRMGYRANRLNISVESAALFQPGWERQLRQLWRGMCFLLRPFYADVRVLHGQIDRGATLYSDEQTEEHPTTSWWWDGIPRTPPLSAAIGEPYIKLWAALEHKGTSVDGIVFLDSPSAWSNAQHIASEDWDPPAQIAQPPNRFSKVTVDGITVHSAAPSEYPPLFPFAKNDETSVG